VEFLEETVNKHLQLALLHARHLHLFVAMASRKSIKMKSVMKVGLSYCGDGFVQAPTEECEPILQDDGTYAAQACGGRTCTVPVCTDNEECLGGCNWAFLPACRVEKTADASSFAIPKRVTPNDGNSALEVVLPTEEEIKVADSISLKPPTDPSFFETESSSSSITPSTIVIDPPLELPIFSIGIQESSSSASSIADTYCGNGLREEFEQCDDGARNSDTLPDSCRTDCLRPLCGDTVTDYGEECDDGNDILGDGCTPLCTKSACGNNVLEPGEECDDGLRNSDTKPDSCSSRCLQPHCGDGLLDASFGEACDQGEDNSNNVPDRCRLNCRRPHCGDGIKDSDEQCDDGNASNFDFCSNQCLIVGCGNGVLERNEACDDGNTVGDDGCSSACTIEKKSFIQWLNNAIRLPFRW
jgi:cysteine-rich repeat protein